MRVRLLRASRRVRIDSHVLESGGERIDKNLDGGMGKTLHLHFVFEKSSRETKNRKRSFKRKRENKESESEDSRQ